MRPRILLADDHVVVREGLRALLEAADFQVVGEARDGLEILKLARTHKPDVTVLDIGMPGLNGVDASRELLREAPDMRVIILTMHAEEAYVVEALRAGARGYVLKTQAGSDLVRSIREVMQGAIYLSPGVSSAVVEAFLAGNSAPRDPLTPREREVLQLIAEGRSTKEVAGVLGLSVKTAETHRTRLMSKLDIHHTAGLVHYAIRRGLIRVS